MGGGKSPSVGMIMILHALARGHGYGFDLIEETGLTSGTIYPTLEKLERAGLARSKWENAETAHAQKRPPRRYFEITDPGKAALIEGLERYRALAPLRLDGETYPRAMKHA